MIERQFRNLWEQLQGKKPHLRHFLSEIRLQGIRGIDDLRVAFDYPVNVIAGGNATGKSTMQSAHMIKHAGIVHDVRLDKWCALSIPVTG